MRFRYRQANLVRQTALWAAIGLAAVILIGPLAVLLFFAALGLCLWLVVRGVYFGKGPAWERTRVLGKKLGVLVAAGAYWGAAWLMVGLERTSHLAQERGGRVASRAWTMARQHFRFLAMMVLETVGGAGVGTLLGYVIANGTDALKPAMIIGAVAGACLGFFVGASRYEPAPESSLRS